MYEEGSKEKCEQYLHNVKMASKMEKSSSLQVLAIIKTRPSNE